MPRLPLRSAAVLLVALGASACGGSARLPVSAGTGPNPELPAPRRGLVPVVAIADATGWAPGEMPTPALGTTVTAFATGLQHPRWLHVLPNGDVLVAETDGPVRPDDNRGIKGFFTRLLMRRAGSGTPSADRITLLRDADGDGMAETQMVFLDGLHSPFGMALVGETLYVANTDAVVSVPYEAGQTRITTAPTTLAALPAGTINHHWTKSLIASADGQHLYVGVGSNSNVGDDGMDVEAGRAAVWEIDTATGAAREFATGLRNPVGLAWEPTTGALWTAVNERDELGSDLVPDYMTSVRRGAFYGWPYSYYGANVDTRAPGNRPDLVARAVVPDYALGPHTASLGLAWSGDSRLPFGEGMYIGQHGSWNRRPRSGYKVVFVPFAGGRPAGAPVDVLTGFLVGDEARGRPVGVAVDTRGGLLVADDVGNAVWRVAAPAGPSGASTGAMAPDGPAVVTLERTACYGRCPAYTVSAFADGRVVFEGLGHVATMGTAVRRVDPAVVAGLVSRAAEVGHAAYPDALTWGNDACERISTDGPTATTTVRTAAGTSRVEHYGGCRGFKGEGALTAFETEVDRALGTADWVGPR
jgi:glucose/arabinose dehydrogenase